MKKVLFMFCVFACIVACNKPVIIIPEDDVPEIKKESEIENVEDGRYTPLDLKPILLNESETEVANASANFAFKLLFQINKESNEENILFSPLSATYALSMLLNGADEQTKKEIITALSFEGLDVNAINSFNKTISNELPNLDNNKFSIANSIWAELLLDILPSYINFLKDSYCADVHTLFRETGLEDINGWIAKNTYNAIPKFYNELPDANLLLINALYYSGGWNIFRKEATRKGDFICANGKSNSADMMLTYGYFRYISNEDFEIVDLPIGNDAFALSIILPNENTLVDDCIEQLNGNIFTSLRQNYDYIDLKLPKVNLRQEYKLKKTLQTLGMEKAFIDDRYHNYFPKISIFQTFVEDIVQKNVLQWDEDGVCGSAATIVTPTKGLKLREARAHQKLSNHHCEYGEGY